MDSEDTTMSKKRALAEFNRGMAAKARHLHGELAKAGHPVPPEEAKFLLVAGYAALAESLGIDSSPIKPTLIDLAAACPKAAPVAA